MIRCQAETLTLRWKSFELLGCSCRDRVVFRPFWRQSRSSSDRVSAASRFTAQVDPNVRELLSSHMKMEQWRVGSELLIHQARCFDPDGPTPLWCGSDPHSPKLCLQSVTARLLSCMSGNSSLHQDLAAKRSLAPGKR